MTIIPAHELSGIKHDDIVECFCDCIMKDIINANQAGKKNMTFVIPNRIFGNPQTHKLSPKYEHDWPYCPFDGKTYREDIVKAFTDAGYKVFKPRGCAYEIIAW